MSGRLVVVAGTGTGIGKTHLAEALLRALGARGLSVVGLKPIETGLDEVAISDAARLERASTFHVQQRGYFYAAALSPHLAAREAGEVIHSQGILASVEESRQAAHVTIVELPGGLFTPLSDSLSNANLAGELVPDTTILVAPDRLGALHDVLSTLRAADTVPVAVDVIVVVPPDRGDPSTGRNAGELRRFVRASVFSLPRQPVEDLVDDPAIQAVAAIILA